MGDWGPCLAVNSSTALQCGHGVQTRRVDCRLARNDSVVLSNDVCLSVLTTSPATQQSCSAGACGCVVSADCRDLAGHHVCSSRGVCVCEAGWVGSRCDVIELISSGANCSSTAIVDVNGMCCESSHAIDSVTGVCCSGAVTDGNGRCCDADATVDACGVCGGDGVAVDVLGVCCSWPLSPSGMCCNGTLDSCGVCGGTNDCVAVVTVLLPVNATASSIATILGLPLSAIVNLTVLANNGTVVRVWDVDTSLSKSSTAG